MKSAWTLYAPEPPNMRMATTITAAATATAAAMRGNGERASPSSPAVRAGLAVARGAKREFQSEYLGTSPGPHYRHLTKVRVRRPVSPSGLNRRFFFRDACVRQASLV